MATIKINERTKKVKVFMAMFKTFFKDVDGIEIIETDFKKFRKKKIFIVLNLLQKLKKQKPI